MKRNGIKCHVVGVRRHDDGRIATVTVEHLEAGGGVANRSTVVCDVHDIIAENDGHDVFDAIAAIEGVVSTDGTDFDGARQGTHGCPY